MHHSSHRYILNSSCLGLNKEDWWNCTGGEVRSCNFPMSLCTDLFIWQCNHSWMAHNNNIKTLSCQQVFTKFHIHRQIIYFNVHTPAQKKLGSLNSNQYFIFLASQGRAHFRTVKNTENLSANVQWGESFSNPFKQYSISKIALILPLSYLLFSSDPCFFLSGSNIWQ